MPGYYVVGTLNVNVVFVALLVVGVGFSELGRGRAMMFVLLWLVGYLGLPHLSFAGQLFGAFLFVPYVALLDTILLLVICRVGNTLG